MARTHRRTAGECGLQCGSKFTSSQKTKQKSNEVRLAEALIHAKSWTETRNSRAAKRLGNPVKPPLNNNQPRAISNDESVYTWQGRYRALGITRKM